MSMMHREAQQLPGSTATTKFKTSMTFCSGTIFIVMDSSSDLDTAGRKIKVGAH